MVKLNLEPTEQFFMAGDVMVRLWQGTSDHGEEVVALIAGVAFVDKADIPAFTEGLVSIPPPTPDDAARWAWKVLGGSE